MGAEITGSFSAIECQDELPSGIKSLWPVDAWFTLIRNRSDWIKAVDVLDDEAQRTAKDAELRGLLASLEKLPAKRWFLICEGAGWFADSAIALSWCEGARFEDVVDVFTRSEVQLNREHADYRAARFLNPSFLSEPRLSAILEQSKGLVPAAQLLLAAIDKLPEIDLPADEVAGLAPSIVHLLVQSGLSKDFHPAIANKTELIAQAKSTKDEAIAEVATQREVTRRKLLQDAADLIPGRMEERRWSRQQVREAVQSALR